jgi:hypothetical protein
MGFLSQCHQKSVQESHIIQVKIGALNNEKSVLSSQIEILDTTLKGLPKTYVTRRIQERKMAGYENKQKRLLEIIEEKSGLETLLISEHNNSNPVSAIADIFKIKHSVIISIFIPLLVLILEPLTIGLTIAANAAWMALRKNHSPVPIKNSLDTANLTEELQNIQRKYNLSVSKIAKITGRKKPKTCEGWLTGSIPTPPRVLADIQAWIEKEYVKKPDE